MEWIERLNEAINYIEEHLADEIDYEELAKIAGCSTYHFQRMFAYMANISLSEYIRRRRMSLAAVDLQGGDAKIIDVALKYGYSSPTAFNRAFQTIHGIAPSLVRSEGVSVKSFPPMTFKITVKGVEEMNYRIEKKEAFRIVGVSMDAEGAFEEYTIPSFTWAIFTGEGVCPQAIQELEQRIVTEWLPTSGYEYDNGPDVELYISPDPQNAKFEVCIPVVKKQ